MIVYVFAHVGFWTSYLVYMCWLLSGRSTRQFMPGWWVRHARTIRAETGPFARPAIAIGYVCILSGAGIVAPEGQEWAVGWGAVVYLVVMSVSWWIFRNDNDDDDRWRRRRRRTADRIRVAAGRLTVVPGGAS